MGDWRGSKGEDSARGGQTVLKTVSSACTRWGFDSSILCVSDEDEWMWITVRVPPGSVFNRQLPKLFEDLGFQFDAARIGLVHSDGTFIEYAPGPPPNHA